MARPHSATVIPAPQRVGQQRVGAFHCDTTAISTSTTTRSGGMLLWAAAANETGNF